MIRQRFFFFFKLLLTLTSVNVCSVFSQLLTLESNATPLHICLPPADPGHHLLAASEGGLLCYDTQLGANNSSNTKR